MQRALIQTCPMRIEEQAPYDDYWGTGSKKGGVGKNMLGKCLMEVRDHYAQRAA